ncbi:ORF6N domain-containing protein [Entomobacter blattae]|uniref:ORF6N domain protein n=1 Tax=Entomobacter blattae TaxID=2762277 RepID=A0A7H1NP85_9PROT|nr:ORF6N domain-containing protein [Entomobacter blattae]QNT77595.1 ORF6N domain protein [Entomobacter blattae]
MTHQDIITVEDKELNIVEYKQRPVLTLEMIDQIHERPKGTAGRNFRENRSRLIMDEDYFELTADEFRRQSLTGIFSPRTPKGILLTETGYLMLVKSFTDEKAWQIQRQLVNGYFKVRTSSSALENETRPNLFFKNPKIQYMRVGNTNYGPCLNKDDLIGWLPTNSFSHNGFYLMEVNKKTEIYECYDIGGKTVNISNKLIGVSHITSRRSRFNSQTISAHDFSHMVKGIVVFKGEVMDDDAFWGQNQLKVENK